MAVLVYLVPLYLKYIKLVLCYFIYIFVIMKNFNLIELGVIYKNFSCFIKDFDSDIQELKDIQEIDELFAFQCSRVTWYGFNNVI